MGPVTAKGGNVCKSDGHPYAFFVATSLQFSMAVNNMGVIPKCLAAFAVVAIPIQNFHNGGLGVGIIVLQKAPRMGKCSKEVAGLAF